LLAHIYIFSFKLLVAVRPHKQMPFLMVKFPQCTNVLAALYIIHVTNISSVHWIYIQQRFDFLTIVLL